MDLTEFLLARIADDEQNLPLVQPAKWRRADTDDEWQSLGPAHQLPLNVRIEWRPSGLSTPDRTSRAAAECESKRRIVERFAQGKAEWAAACEDYSDWAAGTPSLTGRVTTSVSRDGLNELARVLRLLALPYADHPDYQTEWRP